MGCGCGVLISILLIVMLVGWMLSALGPNNPIRISQPVPPNVPPTAGEEVPLIDVHAAGRTADKLSFWSPQLAEDTGIPEQALRAYANAELIARDAWPECGLRWNTLAGIGWVETRHGTYAGSWRHRSSLDSSGVADPPIVGIALDGSPGFAEIKDTDGGALDGDTEFDRAVGPMQFIPESWQRFGRDANGDGVADPQQIDDAALAAANLLCSNRTLSAPEGWTQGIRSYNNSTEYVINVRDAANAYALRQYP